MTGAPSVPLDPSTPSVPPDPSTPSVPLDPSAPSVPPDPSAPPGRWKDPGEREDASLVLRGLLGAWGNFFQEDELALLDEIPEDRRFAYGETDSVRDLLQGAMATLLNIQRVRIEVADQVSRSEELLPGSWACFNDIVRLEVLAVEALKCSIGFKRDLDRWPLPS